ncbi:MAG: SDR family NAD(P)-dependent oxidoreductase [Nitrospinota bacterium]
MDWKGRKVLVTGGGGFIGSHLVEALLERGAEVTAFVRYTSRGSAGFLDPIAEKIRIVANDITEFDGVRQAMENQDSVFHLAALIGIPFSFEHPWEVVQVNTMGTLNILSAARQTGPRRVILTSTSEVYGTAQYVPIDESHPLQAQSPYSASKIAADKLGESFHHTYGLPVVTVRPFNTYGPRQSVRAVIPTMITQMLAGDTVRLGATSPTRDFNFVQDTVRGFIQAAEAPDAALGEALNLATGKEISIGDLAAKIASLLGKEIEIQSEEQRLRPGSSEVMRLCGDGGKAAGLIGWKPAFTLDEGLERTIGWLRESGGVDDPARYRV